MTANRDEAPSFFYDEPQRTQCLSFLLHLAPYSNDLLLVCGEEGSGKTTLIKQFVSKASAAWEICIVELQPDLSAHVVAEYILAELKSNTEVEYDNAAVDSLSSCFKILQSRGRRPILIFDDAHLLTEETLQFLDQLISSSQAEGNGISIILFGENNLPEIAGFALLKRHGLHSFDLPSLHVEEVALYLHHRLKQAGISSDRLSVTDIKEIAKDSNGNFGLIELYSDAHLHGSKELVAVQAPMLPAIIATQPRFNKRLSIINLMKWAGGLAIAIVLVIALVFQDDINNSVTTPDDENQLATKAEESIIVPSRSSLDHTADVVIEPEIKPELSSSQSHQEAAIDLPVIEKADIDDAEDGQQLSPVLGEISQKITALPLSSENEPQTEVVEPSIVLENELPQTELPRLAKADLPEPATVKDKPEKIIEPITEVVVEALPAETVRVAAPSPVVKRDVAQDNAWLVARNAQHYTIQLMALRKKAGVLGQLKTVEDQSRYAIFSTQRKGRALHILLYGDFFSSKEARLAEQALPAQFSKNKPWIRTFSGIKKELQALAE